MPRCRGPVWWSGQGAPRCSHRSPTALRRGTTHRRQGQGFFCFNVHCTCVDKRRVWGDGVEWLIYFFFWGGRQPGLVCNYVVTIKCSPNKLKIFNFNFVILLVMKTLVLLRIQQHVWILTRTELIQIEIYCRLWLIWIMCWSMVLFSWGRGRQEGYFPLDSSRCT